MCLPNCGSSFYDRDNNKTGIGFFKFPTDLNRRRLWICGVGNVRRKGPGDNFTITPYTRICQYHFNTSDINVSSGIGRKTSKKNSNAIPVFKNKADQKPLRRSPKKRIFETESNNEDQEDTDNETRAVTDELNEMDILQLQLNNLQNENLQLKQELSKTNEHLNNSITTFKIYQKILLYLHLKQG